VYHYATNGVTPAANLSINRSRRLLIVLQLIIVHARLLITYFFAHKLSKQQVLVESMAEKIRSPSIWWLY